MKFVITLFTIAVMLECQLSASPHNLIILDEVQSIQFSGLKASFTTFIIEKEITFEVKTSEGAELLRQFELPEPIDEAYLNRAPKVQNLDFFVDNMRVDEFRVEVKSGYDRWVEKRFTETVENERLLPNPERGYATLTKYIYKLPLLKVGDVIKITYSWSAPLAPNLAHLGSGYLYHHGKYPKHAHTLNLEYPKGLEIFINYPNGDAPNKIRETVHKTMIETWVYKDLPASLSEAGIKPYEKLPHITYSILNYSFSYWQGGGSVGFTRAHLYLPHTYTVAMQRQGRMFGDEMSLRVGSTSKQYMAIRRITRKYRKEGEDGFSCFKRIHNAMASEYPYFEDDSVYTRESMFPPGLGTSLESGEFHHLMRYRIYNALLHELDTKFMFSYLCDRNHSQSEINLMKPYLLGDYLFAVLDSAGRVHYAYPKYQQSGYFLDELPYYFEDCRTVMLEWIQPKDKQHIQENAGADFRLMKTPGSNWQENVRNVNSLIKLDASDSAVVNTQMILKGQFSTMMRPLYTHGEVHTEVNPVYNEAIWNTESGHRLKSSTSAVLTMDFPFTTKVTCEYMLEIRTEEDGFRSLRIGELLKHVYHENLDTSNRTMDYYPDFMCQDRFAFRLELAEPATEVEIPEIIYADSPYGHYEFRIETSDNKVFNILSSYVVKKASVPLASIDWVAEINQALKQTENLVIRFR